MLDTAAAAPYDPDDEVSATGRGRGDRLCRALYASADVESVLFGRIWEGKGLLIGLEDCVARRSRNPAVRREAAMRQAGRCLCYKAFRIKLFSRILTSIRFPKWSTCGMEQMNVISKSFRLTASLGLDLMAEIRGSTKPFMAWVVHALQSNSDLFGTFRLQ